MPGDGSPRAGSRINCGRAASDCQLACTCSSTCAVSVLYIITIIGWAIGETWAYYLLGSFIEVILLLAIARTAWKWPPPQIAPSLP